MILTEVAAEELPQLIEALGRQLAIRDRAVLERIAATSPQRAVGETAQIHHQAAVALAQAFGMGVVASPPEQSFSWDGKTLTSQTEAYVLLHEVAHFQLSDPARRTVPDFGLGAGPDTGLRPEAEAVAQLFGLEREQEEAQASLLGIIWEVELGQPALASFLDQNWLEGAARQGTAEFFAKVLQALREGGFVTQDGRPTRRIRGEPDHE